ncbi:hypothetical protein V8G54_016196 [Vigna mungo]|uniref:Uncharacterized protein n=1 Tax=Vigna mungo TaxID=3915 RepID=A0AAQ3NKP5_VIGMU
MRMLLTENQACGREKKLITNAQVCWKYLQDTIIQFPSEEGRGRYIHVGWLITKLVQTSPFLTLHCNAVLFVLVINVSYYYLCPLTIHAPQKHHTPDLVLTNQIPCHVRVYTDCQS